MVRQSDSIAALADALSKAQGEVENASKNASNPAFRSRYADLAEIINTVRPVLAKYGLALVQFPGYADGVVTLDTVLTHKSGEWMSGTAGAPIPPKETKDGRVLPADAQSVGSALTYLRRYSMAAVCGITQEDDDGNAASAPRHHHEDAPAAHRPEPKHDAPTDDGEMIPCPRCGGAMWDNRTGKKNPKGPDLKCKSKECDHAVWLPSWQKDLNAEILAAHNLEAIDAHERSRAEAAVATLIPAKMDTVQKWLDALANPAGV